MLLDEIRCSSRGKQLVSELMVLHDRRQKLHLFLEGSDRDQDIALGDLESGSDQRLHIRLILVLSETSDLPG